MITRSNQTKRPFLLWRGAFLTYTSSESEIDSLIIEWACRKIENAGMNPCVKPGSQVLGAMLEIVNKLQRKLMFPLHYLNNKDNVGKPLMVWSPPRTEHPEEDEKLAEILSLLCTEAIEPEDARVLLAQINERTIETESAARGIQLIECRATVNQIYHAVASTNCLTADKVQEAVYRSLAVYHIHLVRDTVVANQAATTR